MFKSLLLICILFFVASCAPMITLLKGPNGDIAKCESSPPIWVGAIIAELQIKKCVEAYEKAGYVNITQKGIDEPL